MGKAEQGEQPAPPAFGAPHEGLTSKLSHSRTGKTKMNRDQGVKAGVEK